MDWVLFIRLAVGAGAAFLVGATAVVTIQYTRAWIARGRPKRDGLLPFHVAAVGLSYDLLLIHATISALMRTEEGGPLSIWRTAVVAPAIVLGLVAMYIIATLRKKDKLRTEI